MKKMLSKITLAALAVALLGGCSKINERIDNLEKRVDGLKEEKIASVESQIAGINSSISDLEKIKSDIETLKAGAIAQDERLIGLKIADSALVSLIGTLRKYTDTLVTISAGSYAKKEWVKATFSTLEQYQAACDTIANIDARIGELDKKLAKDIKDCADSLKNWVNGQFEAYYIAAEVDGKLDVMETLLNVACGIMDGTSAEVDSLDAEFAKVRGSIDDVKTVLKAEYKAAVESAIMEFEGSLTSQIASAVAAAGAGIPDLVQKVSALEPGYTDLVKKVASLQGRIQSVAIAPAYGDGSVRVENDSIYLTCIIKPASAVEGLTKDNFGIIPEKLKTKGKQTQDTVRIDEYTVIDTTGGMIELKADFRTALGLLLENNALSIALHVQTKATSYTTGYVKVTGVGWLSIGKCNYTDDIVLSTFLGETCTYEVEVKVNVDKPGIYRMVYPYGAAFPYSEPGDYDTSRDYNIDINAADPDGVYIELQETGLDWGYGMFSIISSGYYSMTHGQTFDEVKAAGGMGTLRNNVITFPTEGLYLGMNAKYYKANKNGAFCLDLSTATY